MKDETGYSLAHCCKEVGVSLSSYRRWLNELMSNEDFQKKQKIDTKSRRPHVFARALSASTKQRVIEEAGKDCHQSANSITRQLKAEGVRISTSTVIEVLEEAGLYGVITTYRKDGMPVRKSGLLKCCQERQQAL